MRIIKIAAGLFSDFYCLKSLLLAVTALHIIFITSCKKEDNPVIPLEPVSSWSEQNSNVTNNLKAVYFINSLTGYAAGNSFPNDTNKLIKTTDGGNNWFRLPVNINDSSSYNSIFFIDENTGFVAGSRGKINKTTDAGATWVPLPTNNQAFLYDIKRFDNNNYLACGTLGTMLRSTNGTLTWSQVQTGTSFALYSISVNNTGSAFACGDAGTMIKTIDFGETWQTVQCSTTISLKSIFFTNSNTGIACGQAGTIIRTTNGGNIWVHKPISYNTDLSSVNFINNTSTGFITGDQGMILKTEDYGENFRKIIPATQYYLRQIYFSDINSGWAVGEFGTILHSANGGN